MDIVMKGRGGVHLTEQMRRMAEQKLSKLERRPWPTISRVEVEVVGERNPSVGEKYHVQVAAVSPRQTFRAHAGGPDVDSSLDLVVERLARQISTYRSKRTTRTQGRTPGLQSGMTSSEGPGED